jgi:hypothetical protein
MAKKVIAMQDAAKQYRKGGDATLIAAAPASKRLES